MAVTGNFKFNQQGGNLIVDPSIIVVREGFNGRYQDHSEESINRLAKVFREIGQVHPVGLTEDGELIYGHRRRLAAMKCNEGLKPGDPGYMPIKFVFVKGKNPTEQQLANLSENLENSALSHMDIAFNIGKLRNIAQWKDTRIAEFFGKTPAWVSQHASLLNLVDEWRNKVHDGEVAMSDAMEISRMSYDEQRTKLGIVNEAIAELAQEPEFAFLNEPEAPEFSLDAVIEATSGTTADPVTPVEAKIAENAAKKLSDKKKAVSKKVTAKTVAASKTPSRVQVARNGKRSWGDLYELFEGVGPANSKRLQILSDVMRRGMTGADEFRDDHAFLDTLERLLDDASIETMTALNKPFKPVAATKAN